MPSKPENQTATRRSLRVLFTCVGRRVELVRAFRAAGERLGIDLTLHGSDITWLSPAIHHVDHGHIMPRISDPDYIPALVDLARTHDIDVLIPLLDPELPLLSAATERFSAVGCCALVSDESVINICRDKISTYEALAKAGIDTPQTWRWDEVAQREDHEFPYFLKPIAGSAAVGNYVVHNEKELAAFGARVEDAIVQEFVPGVEHTLDVYTGLTGVPQCVVPRRRIQVRGGEVTKGIVVKDPDVIEMGYRVARMLGGCRGVVTVQCMVTPQRRIRVIEMNARFGGGAPLAIYAGADFPRWIMEELLGDTPQIDPLGYRNDVAFLRFDDSVFLEEASRFLT